MRDLNRIEWAPLALDAVADLERMLGIRFKPLPDEESIATGDGFSLELESVPQSGILGLRVRALVGGQLVADKPHVRAWLFLYQGQRHLKTDAGEALQLIYSGGRRWQNHGWLWGEHGEFDYFTEAASSSGTRADDG